MKLPPPLAGEELFQLAYKRGREGKWIQREQPTSSRGPVFKNPGPSHDPSQLEGGANEALKNFKVWKEGDGQRYIRGYENQEMIGQWLKGFEEYLESAVKLERATGGDINMNDAATIGEEIRAALDVAGLLSFVPGGAIISIPASVLSFLISMYKKDYDKALLDLIGIIPLAGKATQAIRGTGSVEKAAGGVKAVEQALKLTDAAAKVAAVTSGFKTIFENFPQLATFVRNVLEKTSSVFSPDSREQLQQRLEKYGATPEAIQENKQLDRWKLLAGIK